MGGLRWWARAHWVREQRRQWREHDARLATLWHAETAVWTSAGRVAAADVDDDPDRVIVLPDVIVLPESGARMSVSSR